MKAAPKAAAKQAAAKVAEPSKPLHEAQAVPAPSFGKCACGGGCPRCRNGAAMSTNAPSRVRSLHATPATLQPSNPRRRRDETEEARAHGAVTRLTSTPRAVTQLTHQLGDRAMPSGVVGRDMRNTLQPFTGALPSDLTLRTGPDVDRALTARRARGLAVDNEMWIGGPRLTRSPGGFASVLVHEAAHVASGGSRAANPPHFDFDDTLPGSPIEALLARERELEAAETGEGRQRTLDRLPTMSEEEVRREAPGIAFRAEDRGDIELAQAAAQRLLEIWIQNREAPVFLHPIGHPDAVDALLPRAERAFTNNRWELGGTYLAIVMVQLVRAANVAMLGRALPDVGEGHELALALSLPMQRITETQIRERVERARALLSSLGESVLARGDATEIARFESIANAVNAAEEIAGPAIVSDLGTGGVPEAAPRSGRGHVRRTEAEAEAPPPERAPDVSRAQEDMIDGTHPQLENALVLYTDAPRTFGNIRSPRYGVAGTFEGARRLAGQLFGRRSCVIVEDTFARTADGTTREVRYLVLALDTHINPNASAVTDPESGLVRAPTLHMVHPEWSRYFFLAVTAGQWYFFSPPLLDYIGRIQESEANVVNAPMMSDEARRTSIFSAIDALIAAGEIQEAANQLTYLGAEGFALVDTEAKIRYLSTLINALTFGEHAETAVEIFASVRDVAELRTVFAGLHRDGLLDDVIDDFQSVFPSLLMMLGQNLGPEALSTDQVTSLLSELRILRVFPGIELRGDLSIAFTGTTDVVREFQRAFEGLVNTITGAVTGVLDILLDPRAFIEGIGKLAYYAVVFELARYGFPPAMERRDEVLMRLGQQLGIMARGMAVMQESMPEGVEFVRDMQRTLEWRIIWEVIGLFVGVGEVVAFVDAVRGGRVAAAIGEVANGLRGARALEEGVDAIGTAERIADTAGDTARTVERTGGALADTERVVDSGGDAARAAERGADEVTEGAGDVARTERAADEAEEAAEGAGRAADEAPAVRELDNGARLRVGADGRRRLCINPCAELDHLSLSDDVIDAAVGNLPREQTRELVETLAAFRGADDIPAIESLVTSLSRGGDEAASSIDLLERITGLRNIDGMTFNLPDLVAAHRRGDAILAHGPLQDAVFLEDIPWGGAPAGPFEIHDGRLTFLNRPSLSEHGLPAQLRTIDFVIIQGEGGAHRLVLGLNHSGLSGGRPWVFGAGQLELSRSGEIISISRMSGHYQPSVLNPARVREFLRERGVLGRRAVDAIEEVR